MLAPQPAIVRALTNTILKGSRVQRICGVDAIGTSWIQRAREHPTNCAHVAGVEIVLLAKW